MKILVTGFDPFGGESINPALEVIKSLPKQIAGAEILLEEIPTVFYQAASVLEEAMAKYTPDIVLCIGQAGGRTELTPERVAINQDDARIPDNLGQQPIDTMIREDGQPAYFQHYLSKQWLKPFVQQVFQPLFLILQGPLSATISCTKLFT